MKNWSSALFPLSLLLVLAALTLWLRYTTEIEEPRRDGKDRHDPDYIVNNTVLKKFNKQGQLQYIVESPEVSHYPDDETTHLKAPRLTYQHPDKPTVTTTAERGLVTEHGDRVDLSGNVHIKRAATARRLEMNAHMDELTAFPNDETGFTKSAVLVTEGASWLKGVGMKADLLLARYELESAVRALIVNNKDKVADSPKPRTATSPSAPVNAQAKPNAKPNPPSKKTPKQPPKSRKK